MKAIIQFLKELQKNNHKEWFDANKLRYKEAQATINAFADQLISGISKFDGSVKTLSAKNCTFRIYRDVRFSPDKTPYKTHFGVHICPGGKMSGYAGYYFHIEPKGSDYIGGSILSAGLHCPQPNVLKSVRDAIYTEGKTFETLLKKAKGFTLDDSSSLRKLPKEFPDDTPYSRYIKLRTFDLSSEISDKTLYGDDLLAYCLTELKKTAPLVQFLNRSVVYAMEEA
ncbi:TIGR02453 family protein [Bacteroidia bacterium]|nr:TIGR02453 family protein [Bacteroidia bacterium]